MVHRQMFFDIVYNMLVRVQFIITEKALCMSLKELFVISSDQYSLGRKQTMKTTFVS